MNTDILNNQSTMLENFSVRGLWYLSGMNKEDGLIGTLEYTPKEIKLNLVGNFKKIKINKTEEIAEVEEDQGTEEPVDVTQNLKIWGFSENGKKILLDNCFILKEKSYLTGGIESTTYKVQTIFVSNSEILDSDFNSIQKVSFSFKDFESWHSSSPITFQKEDGKGNKKTGFLYSYSDLQQKCQTIFLD